MLRAKDKENLVRKQVLLSVDNIEKLEALAASNKISVAEVVRNAIDSYSPDDIPQSDLMELVSGRVQEALEDTTRTRKRLNKLLKKLDMQESE